MQEIQNTMKRPNLKIVGTEGEVSQLWKLENVFNIFPNSEDMDLMRPPLIAMQDWQWRDKDTNPPTKLLTLNQFCLKEMQGQKLSRAWGNGQTIICHTWDAHNWHTPVIDIINDAPLCLQAFL